MQFGVQALKEAAFRAKAALLGREATLTVILRGGAPADARTAFLREEPSALTFAVRESLDVAGAYVIVALLSEYPDEGSEVVAVLTGHDAEHNAWEIVRLLNMNTNTVARYLSGAAELEARQ